MTSYLTIREATTQDLNTICEFNRLLAEETENIQLDINQVQRGVKIALSSPELCRYFIGEVQGQPVGQTMLTYEITDWLGGINWWIQSVYFEKDSRGQGFFKQMYTHIVQLAKAQQEKNQAIVPRIRLYVDKDNQPAIDTYERLGMQRMHYHMYQTKIQD